MKDFIKPIITIAAIASLIPFKKEETTEEQSTTTTYDAFAYSITKKHNFNEDGTQNGKDDYTFSVPGKGIKFVGKKVAEFFSAVKEKYPEQTSSVESFVDEIKKQGESIVAAAKSKSQEVGDATKTIIDQVGQSAEIVKEHAEDAIEEVKAAFNPTEPESPIQDAPSEEE